MSQAAVQRCSCKVGKIVEKYFLRRSFIVKLQAECCNFAKSEPLHYFLRILLTFLEIFAIVISPYFSLSLLIPPYLLLSLPQRFNILSIVVILISPYLSLSPGENQPLQVKMIIICGTQFPGSVNVYFSLQILYFRSCTAEFLVDLMFLPVRAETAICLQTRTLKLIWFYYNTQHCSYYYSLNAFLLIFYLWR